MEKGQPAWSKEYEGPIWKCIESVYEDMLRIIKKIEFLKGTRRVKLEEYPPRALREAIINAVSHRNYIINADVRIFVYPDRIEIKNPGGLLPGVDLDDPDHVPRNPSICSLLYDTGFIERYGYGIQLIKRETENHPLCSVTFKNDSNRFTVIFKKTLSLILDDYDKQILQSAVSPLKERFAF
jgi:ATP-dependent DNA helicase RecG